MSLSIKQVQCPNCGNVYSVKDYISIGRYGKGTHPSDIFYRCKSCGFRFPKNHKVFEKQMQMGLQLSHEVYWEPRHLITKKPSPNLESNLLQFYGSHIPSSTKSPNVATPSMAGIPDAGKPQITPQTQEAYIRQMQSQGKSTYEQQHGGEPLLDKAIRWMSLNRSNISDPNVTAARKEIKLRQMEYKQAEKMKKLDAKLAREAERGKGGKATSLNIGFCRTCGYKISDKNANKAIWKARKHVRTHGYKV